ncbi:hypothetical protein OG765_05615 [Streptomyces sp. NBC_00555]|uniref:hypothetical protein n=1 Tax=Streptomyces sp. NBC_00555 TaxID=2903662 RepID=UPI002255F994|nr:hypothetical protein [Streptomyces sp. NBC_00555]MCX5010458.1 hypothetical protein [Streptomyces sp. NBC_00555]
MVVGDGLVLAPELVQDANDLRWFRPMNNAVVHAALQAQTDASVSRVLRSGR